MMNYNHTERVDKKWALLFVFCMLLYPRFSEAQAIASDNLMKSRVDSLVHLYAEPYLSDTAKAGLSIGVYQKGKLYAYHYGTTEKGKNSLPGNQTLYEIASITKTFTGTLLAKAIVENKMDISDDIRKYLRESYPNLEYKGRYISLRDIATHQSGLPRDIPFDPSLWVKPDFNTLPYQLIALEKDYNKPRYLAELHAIKLDTIPGSIHFQYSNLAVKVLSFALENVYGKTYEALLYQFIFKPLNMRNSAIVLSASQKKMRAKGYSPNGKQMPYGLDNSGAAGGIKSTLPDMLKYLAYHMNEKNSIVRLTHQPIRTIQNTMDALGLFWQLRKTNSEGWRIYQNGGAFGFSSAMVLFLAADTGFVLLANDAGFNSQSQLTEIADNIYRAINSSEKLMGVE